MTGGFCLLQLLTRLVIFFSIRPSYGKSSSTLMYSHNKRKNPLDFVKEIWREVRFRHHNHVLNLEQRLVNDLAKSIVLVSTMLSCHAIIKN